MTQSSRLCSCQSGFDVAEPNFGDPMCQFFPRVHMTLHSLLLCNGVLKENGYPLIFR